MQFCNIAATGALDSTKGVVFRQVICHPAMQSSDPFTAVANKFSDHLYYGRRLLRVSKAQRTANQKGLGGPGTIIGQANDPKTSPEFVWRQIMRSYSAAELTNLEDKEAALSSIMKFLEGAFDDTYVAGLWRKQLPFQLLWKIGRQAKPCEKYRAPSWSWLAVNVRENPFKFSTIS